jgi:hypothetical protein
VTPLRRLSASRSAPALGAPRGAALADAMLSNLVKESKARRAEIAADNGEAPQHDAHAPCCA